ncbi:hypothetical protein [Dongia sp.]|uniref:hypothetical protein n=1 Tax=Dongia sp. TaxID=1977262 RepID=UPI0035B13CD3
MKVAFAFLVGILLGGTLVYWGGKFVLQSGYTLHEMDWNDDGETTFGEMLHAVDVGMSPVTGKPGCRYFFEYKDGRPIKTVCEGKTVSRGVVSW